MTKSIIFWSILTASAIVNWTGELAIALPPPEDLPEEILRGEIILDGRSPIDGKPLTAAEYTELEEKLTERGYPTQVSSDLEQLIFLLQIRKLFQTIIPF
jgi:hypothetical protein